MDSRGPADGDLIWRLAHGDREALEPLMLRWGEPVIDVCFRALRDARRAVDLCAEVWAEAYQRLCYGTSRRPSELGPWLVEVIGEVLDRAAFDERIPSHARRRMHLVVPPPTPAELTKIEALRDPARASEAHERLPLAFSAAAERMLSQIPGPSVLSRISPSSIAGAP